MGAINYFTSDYITIGFNPDYNINDFETWEEMEAVKQFDIEELEEITQGILDKYSFYYFHVVIKPGYYEGFTINIENNFPVFYDNHTERKEANKEATQLKACLVELVNAGLCQVFPGWCTGYADYKNSLQGITAAIKEIREEIKTTPTYRQYNRVA